MSIPAPKVHAGDLVVVVDDGGAEAIAVVEAMDWLLPRVVIRMWRPSWGAFGDMMHGDVDNILRHAPDDDTTAPARAALVKERRRRR